MYLMLSFTQRFEYLRASVDMLGKVRKRQTGSLQIYGLEKLRIPAPFPHKPHFIAPTHPIHRCTMEEHRESGRKLVCVETTVTLLIFNFNFKLAAEFDLSLVKSSQNGNYCRLRHV